MRARLDATLLIEFDVIVPGRPTLFRLRHEAVIGVQRRDIWLVFERRQDLQFQRCGVGQHLQSGRRMSG